MMPYEWTDLTRREDLERDVKRMKNLVKKSKKQTLKSSQKLSLMKGIWKKLKITDEELEEAKKSIFNFDVEKYI